VESRIGSHIGLVYFRIPASVSRTPIEIGCVVRESTSPTLCDAIH